jgi:hypothetical protein
VKHTVLLCVVATAVALAPAAAAQQPTKPTFKATTAIVLVDVAVRSGSQPVTGLAASDFKLLDNGVEQSIEAVSVGAVPVDVTLLVDTSPSVIDNFDQFRDNARRLPTLLRTEDRLRVVTFDRRVIEAGPMLPAGKAFDSRRVVAGEGTSIFDALLYVFLWEPVLTRRHVIVVLTDAVDTTSALHEDDIRRLAGRTDATLYLALVEPVNQGIRITGGGVNYRSQPVGVGRSPEAVLAAAVLMGGLAQPHRSSKDFLRTFKEIFDEFKNRYVLRYEPKGVPAPGWHDISVTVTRSPEYAVTARKGYFGG